MTERNVKTLPRGFFGRLAALAFEAEVARADALAAAGRNTRASVHRSDAEALCGLLEDCRGRLPTRMRQVAELCIESGLTIADAADRLQISPNTVRGHLARLRAIQRRNAHVKRRPRSAELAGILQ